MEILANDIKELLKGVKDPEIPLVNIVGMGIVRDVELFDDNQIKVRITPTYSGCPAMNVIKEDIVTHLNKQGFYNVVIETVLSPAWTTDWMDEETRENLVLSGIAAPEKREDGDDVFVILKPDPKISCPFCKSKDTIKKSQFGATACKALYFCNSCSQPFEYFKCH